jgi:hypothetical protein
VIIKCIYCGFEVTTGLNCCGIKYKLDGTYEIIGKRNPPIIISPIILPNVSDNRAGEARSGSSPC